MKLFRLLTLILTAAFAVSPVSAQPQQEVVSWKSKVEHVKDDVYRITFTANMQAGWHIYDLGPYEGGPCATTFDFEKNANVELVGKVKLAKPNTRHFDDVWQMEVGYLEGQQSFTQDVRLKGDKATLKGLIEWQSCDDERCQPPGEYEFSVEIVRVTPKVAEAVPAVQSSETTTAANAAVAASVGAEQPADETTVEQTAENDETVSAAVEENAPAQADNPAKEKRENEGFWGKILMAIVWGLMSILTPCVFPMVPVTVSFFMKGSENKAKAKFRAASFGTFIVILYTLPIVIMTLIAEMFGGAGGAVSVFNWLGTHWLPNLIFFSVFMVFAASFFGAFELTLPSSMINKSDSKADKGGLIGVFFMALTLVLISFSCTAPIVSYVIVDSATTSTTWWAPIIIMLVYSVVFAIPFTLLAFVPSLMSKLKSGSWMNVVKVSIGFVEVALAFKFLMMIDQNYNFKLLSREIYLSIWIVCGLLWGLYLLGVYKTKHDSDTPFIGPLRLGFAIVIFVFTVWMFPGLWGAPLDPIAGYMPPLTAQNYTLASYEDIQNLTVSNKTDMARFDGKINPLTGLPPKYSDIDGIHAPKGFVAFFDFNEASEYAKHVNKPLFIDFTGVSCVNCRKMEQTVWRDPTVAEILKNDFVMVCIYMDIRVDLAEKDWVTTESGEVLKRMNKVNMYWAYNNFNTVAQPEYVLFDPRSGQQLVPKRAFDTDIPAYVAWLREGLANFHAK